MSSRHYWPEPPNDYVATYLVEHENGESRLVDLDNEGRWYSKAWVGHTTSENLANDGYLGVRTPFDEEAERVEFEAVFGPIGLDLSRYKNGVYINEATWAAHKGWLAAKRHERGL